MAGSTSSLASLSFTFMKATTFSSTFFTVLFSSVSFAASTLEYRLETKEGGVAFKTNDGTTLKLESSAFLSGRDFVKAVVRDPKNPNSPGKFDVDLLHSESGKKKFREVANRDRERSYCVVFESVIWQCYGFPPEVKGLYENGSSISAPLSKLQAKKLAAEINASIK